MWSGHKGSILNYVPYQPHKEWLDKAKVVLDLVSQFLFTPRVHKQRARQRRREQREEGERDREAERNRETKKQDSTHKRIKEQDTTHH